MSLFNGITTMLQRSFTNVIIKFKSTVNLDLSLKKNQKKYFADNSCQSSHTSSQRQQYYLQQKMYEIILRSSRNAIPLHCWFITGKKVQLITSWPYSSSGDFKIHFITNGIQNKQQVMYYSTVLNSRRSKFTRKSFIVNTFCVILGIMYMEHYLISENFANTLPKNPAEIGSQKPSGYILLNDPMELPGISFWQRFFPWISSCVSLDHVLSWRLAQETKSQDNDIRTTAIRKLASLKDLTDAECRAIAFIIDFRTAVELAHSDADPRMVAFNKCRFTRNHELLFPTKFREIFGALPPEAIHFEVHELAQEALKRYHPTETENEESRLEIVTGFESEPILVKTLKQLSEQQFLKHCLSALLSHSRNKDQIPVMLNYGTLDLLSDIATKYEDNLSIMAVVTKIFSNLSWHRDFYYEVKKSGILRLLTELSQSNEFQLNLPARKALHNLDRSENTPMIPPGIYQLYPDFKVDESLLGVDVIFVHGIKGSTFRTWRANDKLAYWAVANENNIDSPDNNRSSSASNKFSQRIGALKSHIPFSYFLSQQPTSEINAEEQAGRIRKRIDSIRKRLYFPDDPILGSDLDYNHRPLNREYRDGKLYYFSDEEEIALEKSFVPAPPTKCWPRDWLPKDINETRLLSVDYDTFVSHWSSVKPVESLGLTVSQRSVELLDKLVSCGVGNRPIVWVTHSAGGILVKQLLVTAGNSLNESMNQVCKRTKGVFFYSTPHFGSSLATLTATGKLFLPTIEMMEMCAGSDDLLVLNNNFKTLVEKYDYHVVSLGEMLGTLSGVGIYVKMVPLKSSDPGYGEYYALKTDHLGICKPISRGSFIYLKLVDFINSLLEEQKKG